MTIISSSRFGMAKVRFVSDTPLTDAHKSTIQDYFISLKGRLSENPSLSIFGDPDLIKQIGDKYSNFHSDKRPKIFPLDGFNGALILTNGDHQELSPLYQAASESADHQVKKNDCKKNYKPT